MSLFTENTKRRWIILRAVMVTVAILGCIVFSILPSVDFIKKNSPVGGNIAPVARPRAMPTTKTDDSIGIVLDLHDSLLYVTCHNVILRTCPVARIMRSSAINALEQSGRLKEYLNAPFIKETETATIPKVPIKIKKAPKDSLTAARESAVDSCSMPKKGDVALYMRFNNDLTITVYQREKYSSKTLAFSLPLFYCVKTSLRISRSLWELVHGRIAPISKDISIELTHDDAAIVYRAFSKNGKFTILK